MTPHQIEVVPSLPATSFTELEALLKALKHVSAGFQVDIVDGVFVSAPPSWPFNLDDTNPTSELKRLDEYASDFRIEIDCMVSNPSQYFQIFQKIGVQQVVLHVGSSPTLAEDIKSARVDYGFDVFLGVLNGTSYRTYESLVPSVSGVQVMGIASIGVQGQPFDSRTLQTISNITKHFPLLPVAVDGSVNKHTIPRLVAAGATRLAPGSAISKAGDPKASYLSLLSLANQQPISKK